MRYALRGALLLLSIVLAACTDGGLSRPDAKVAETEQPEGRDSLATIAELEKALADEARLASHATLPIARIRGLYSEQVSIGADRMIILQADSLLRQQYVSFGTDDLSESVSEFELAPLLSGLDSVIAAASRPARKGVKQQVTYHTSGGLTLGFLDSPYSGRTAFIGGSGGTFFLPLTRLKAVRDAVTAARDSMQTLRGLEL